MKDLERYIVEHASPTLARIKTAGLFTIKYINLDDLKSRVNGYNKAFFEKSVKIKILKTKDNIALIYVYRENLLIRDLNNDLSKDILIKYGYINFEIEEILNRLKDRLSLYKDFPHEIGLFLGYPPEDVIGFICNEGKNCNLCGYWKVYGDTKSAIIKFAKYDKCRAVYKKLWQEGRDILRLTVA